MTVADFNQSGIEKKTELLLQCCRSFAWVKKMIAVQLPVELEAILGIAQVEWNECNGQDWLEAFKHHPKIGDITSLKKQFASTAHFALSEQSAVNVASDETLQQLADGNDAYEKKFGFIFIICATGKSAEEMLSILKARLANTPEEEIKIAANEQSKITRLRLQKLFI